MSAVNVTLCVLVVVFRSSSLDKLYGLHCGPVLRKGQDPGEQIYRLPFQSGDADR